ncbi:MAG: dephospho-CoA kinase [Burkholderiaceae bacterium]
MKLRIGLTGGIGSGKSTVAAQLVQHGATLVDVDAIAHRLTEPGGAAIDALAAAFGPEIVTATGALDRDRMRRLVFTDAAAKRRLEDLLHPMIGAQAQRQADAAPTPILVFDIPLLVESAHWRARVDRVLVVDCTPSTQVARVVERSGLSPQAVLAIIAQQATRPRRRACADAVIHNDALSMDELAHLVASLWRLWVRPCVEGDGAAQ